MYMGWTAVFSRLSATQLTNKCNWKSRGGPSSILLYYNNRYNVILCNVKLERIIIILFTYCSRVARSNIIIYYIMLYYSYRSNILS